MQSNLQFEPADLERWRSVAHASAAVIMITQRDNGIWSYPVSTEEVTRYSDGSAPKAFFQKYGSYTATWSFLLALERLFGRIPSQVIRDLERWFVQNPPYHGAYGAPIPTNFSEQPRVDASARHSGYALLIRMRFLPHHRPEEWKSIALWIADNKTPNLGWKHVPLDPADDAMSTGACVAALAYFLSNAGGQIDARGRTKVERALREGIESLLSEIGSHHLWVGHRPGQTDVLDSALIVELFLLPEVLSQLDRIAGANGSAVKRCQKIMASAAERNGWPTMFERADVSLAATINGLLVTLDYLIQDRENTALQHVYSVSTFILDQLEEHDGGSWLMSWEWAYLGSLSSAILLSAWGHGIRESERQKIERDTVRIKRRKYFLTKIPALTRLPSIAYGPILFVLTQGRLSLNRGHVRWGAAAKYAFKIASFAQSGLSLIKK